MEAQLDTLTLANLADGALEAQFQECLQRLGADIIAELGQYECGKDGDVTASIKMTAKFAILPGDGAAPSIMVAVRADLDSPKRKLIARSVHWQKRSNEFVVWANEPQQEPLFDTKKVAPIEGRK
jgi:hypothetical protein